MDKFYDVVKVSTSSSFQLLGHGERTGIYPSWVTPMGNLDGRPAIVYNQREIVRASFVNDENNFVLYDTQLKEKLSGFNFQNDHLFAYAKDDIEFHNESNRVSFVQDALSRCPEANPFVRLSLAHGSEDREIILDAIKGCVNYLKGTDFLPIWYEGEIDLIRRKELGLGMSELADELEQPGRLELLLD
jgi:hypothetical protein